MDIISQMIYFILILTSKKNGSHYKLLFFLNTYHVHNNKISIFNEIEKNKRYTKCYVHPTCTYESFDNSVF